MILFLGSKYHSHSHLLSSRFVIDVSWRNEYRLHNQRTAPSVMSDSSKPTFQTISRKVKFSHWKNIDTMECVRSATDLPDAEINVLKPKMAAWYGQLNAGFDSRLTELVSERSLHNNKRVMNIWRSRSGEASQSKRPNVLQRVKDWKGV